MWWAPHDTNARHPAELPSADTTAATFGAAGLVGTAGTTIIVGSLWSIRGPGTLARGRSGSTVNDA
ncbi:hypothetical protein [Microbacterium pumilum]|uniref:Uncharacterized protein n=1 Tax=Microbacterium pumilum TaxID=344165 RepID=A0ABP5E5E9_9MICO